MLSALFPTINAIDLLLSSFLPLVLRISMWGALAGGAATAVYVITSNQASIANLKKRSREIRRQMKDPALESRSEFMELAKKNLKASMLLLGKVIGPALLSMLPVLLLVFWLDAYHGHLLPEEHEAVQISTVPANPNLDISPPELISSGTEGISILLPRSKAQSISILVDGVIVYSGKPFTVPVPVITKKKWWNILFSSPIGYLSPDAPIDAIRINLPRKHVIDGLPAWAAGWEVSFFISLVVAVVALRFAFKIQ